MGTTSTALDILPQGAIVAHVGDSRCYRLRGNLLEQLSADHSLVWEMMAANKIAENELPNYIPKNVITRSLGPNQRVQVDVEGPFAIAAGDTFLLCSDGLSGQVTDDEIGIILQTLPPTEAVQTLVDLANLRGGPDNISVIIARITGVPSGASATSNLSSPNSSGGKGSTNPVFWIVFGVAALAAAALMFTGETTLAIVSAGVAVASLVAMLLRGATSSDAATAEMPTMQQGRGPYRSQVCTPGPEFLNRLGSLIEPIRQSSTEQQWKIDWTKVDRLVVASKEAAKRGDFNDASRELCRALSLLMREVRSQPRKKSAGPAA